MKFIPRVMKFDRTSRKWVTLEALRIDANESSDFLYSQSMQDTLLEMQNYLVENNLEDKYGAAIRLPIDKEAQESRISLNCGYLCEYTFTDPKSQRHAQVMVYQAETQIIKKDGISVG